MPTFRPGHSKSIYTHSAYDNGLREKTIPNKKNPFPVRRGKNAGPGPKKIYVCLQDNNKTDDHWKIVCPPVQFFKSHPVGLLSFFSRFAIAYRIFYDWIAGKKLDRRSDGLLYSLSKHVQSFLLDIRLHNWKMKEGIFSVFPCTARVFFQLSIHSSSPKKF